MNSDIFKIEDQFKGMLIFITILIICTLFLPLIVVFISMTFFSTTVIYTSNFGVIIFIQVFLAIFIIPIFVKHIRNNFPPYKVTFLASRTDFQIQIYNKTYKKYLWRDIKKVEFVKEKFSPLTSSKNDVKMKIYTENSTKEVRLYLLKFRKSKIELIKLKIKEFAKIHNIEFIEKKEFEKVPLYERIKEFRKIQTFIQTI